MGRAERTALVEQLAQARRAAQLVARIAPVAASGARRVQDAAHVEAAQ